MKIVRLKDKINGKEITVKVQKDMKPHDIYVSEESGEWLFNKTKDYIVFVPRGTELFSLDERLIIKDEPSIFRKLLKRFIKWLIK